jgi:Na+/phosphate symporter
MKDKRIVVNPFRMISPKLDYEALKIDELHTKPVSESFTLDEGMLVMLSKLIEMVHLTREGFVNDRAEEMKSCDRLAKEVHQQEKMLTANLACSLSVPREVCRTFILFPTHLERIGDFLESIVNCVRTKCEESAIFDDRSIAEVGEILNTMADTMTHFRDVVVTANRFLLERVIADATALDEKCQGWQLDHVERLLAGNSAPRSASLYLDILESTQAINRHLREMARRLLDLIKDQETGN